jgi:hypothetical protein
MLFRDGEPCGHPGCIHHVSHPCEGCGRIAGKSVVTMPTKLTAENGAKAALMGEFFETLEVDCPYCGDHVGGECELCDGRGTCIEKVPVTWTTIKKIYAKAVELLAT